MKTLRRRGSAGVTRRSGQPLSTANTAITAITTPTAILAAAAAARPTRAPHPACTAEAAVPDVVYSSSVAPAKDPTNPAITLPIKGTGTPIAAPTRPPTRAPHPARRDPP